MKEIDPRDDDALTQYVLGFYRQFLSSTEIDALRALNLNLKSVDVESPLVKQKLGDTLERISAPEVISLLANGPDASRRSIRDRLLREYADDIVLATCPKCARLLRTPEARMCVQCGHSWHRDNIC